MDETIQVRLNPALEKQFKPAKGWAVPAVGPALTDPYSKVTIFPGNRDYNRVKGQKVPRTPFIEERLKAGDLVEIKPKPKEPEQPEQPKTGKKKKKRRQGI